jgi:hypothetical protein
MENSVRKSGVITALFGLLIALVMGSVPAQATVPPSHCFNDVYLGVPVVICVIDVNDDGIIDENDLKIIIPIARVLSDNKLTIDELNVLVKALDDLDIDIKNVSVLNNTVVNVLNGFSPVVTITGPLVVVPCGCP